MNKSYFLRIFSILKDFQMKIRTIQREKERELERIIIIFMLNIDKWQLGNYLHFGFRKTISTQTLQSFCLKFSHLGCCFPLSIRAVFRIKILDIYIKLGKFSRIFLRNLCKHKLLLLCFHFRQNYYCFLIAKMPTKHK